MPDNKPEIDPERLLPGHTESTVEILALIDNDVHTVLQTQFAEVVDAAPSAAIRKSYYKENPSHHVRDIGILAKAEQGCKDAGYGHVTDHLTVNISNLGFSQKQKLLEEERKLLEKYESQYSYQNKKVSEEKGAGKCISE